MMDPLHIEMNFINVRGNWLEGSAWVEIFEKEIDFTLGRMESFLHGIKIKLSSYGDQCY